MFNEMSRSMKFIGGIFLLAMLLTVSLQAQRRDGFAHSSSGHRKVGCASCHKIPTPNWPSARGYPDVVDYPGHTACNSCHSGRQFLGLCNSCHVANITPRRAPRFEFPRRSGSQEFNTIFPHNVHQDIIARSILRYPDVAVAHFVKVSYDKAAFDDPQFNNCAVCHKTTATLPRLAARTPAAGLALGSTGTESFVPKPHYFKDMPSGHASCFACHFQGVSPIATNCAGCHSVTAPYRPSDVVRRYSYKFDHDQKEHAARDCMTCHVRISQNADVRQLKDADVPFMACYSCHTDKVDEELKKRSESVANKQPAFQCSYCHTLEVGRFPVPKSHESR